MDNNNHQYHSSMPKNKVFVPEAVDQSDKEGGEITVRDHQSLPVSVSKVTVKDPSSQYVALKHYNSFNFLKLAETFKLKNTAIGITSANKQDGKTMVAVNMAISLAQGYQQKTLLIDFNFLNPQLHNVFETRQSPGLADAMDRRVIKISPTQTTNLFLMTAGDCKKVKPGIEHTLILREILNTLSKEFEFIVIDMTSILPINEFPIHFINEIDGLISVIDTTKTKKNDLTKVFKHVDENRFMGYVFNKVEK
jgi:receptor protein-tyrosine kinase/non-specific protein-tyrosine kinase